MNLVQLRQKFVETSGRWELVVDTTDWADAGADFYIQAGQRLLEGLVTTRQSRGNLYLPLAAGEYQLSWQKSCRVVESVFLETSAARTQLDKVSLLELKNAYTSPVASLGTESPLVYALADLRGIETTAKNSLAEYLDYSFDELVSSADYTGIIIAPVTPVAAVVTISGLFDQYELTDDSDENYWTLRHPGLLLKCALYELETFGRGTAHHKSWMDAIQVAVHNLERDIVEEEIAGVDQMEG